MAYNPKDYYFKKAKTEHYAARSVFKIQEIDERFKIFRSGYRVLDLGASPGSWAQYASEKIGSQGFVLGVDLHPIALTLPNALFLQKDLRDANLQEILQDLAISPSFDVVMSDMAPKTTGIRITDQVRSSELCHIAIEVAALFLKERGNFVCKLFHGDDFEAIRRLLRERFGRVEILRPKSTRKASKEIFLVGLQHQKKAILKSF